MRIRSRVALVGGIPIVIAAAIAVIAWFLLNEAERTRRGAVLAGAVYREFLTAMTTRDAFVAAQGPDRHAPAAAFRLATAEALARLDELAGLARDGGHRGLVADTRAALVGYRNRMVDLAEATERTDRLTAEMGERASSLIALTDEARARQHRSNTDIVNSLSEGDRRLRLARDIVDRAQELRAAVAALGVQRAQAGENQALGFALARMRNAAGDLGLLLRDDRREASARELMTLAGAAESDGGAEAQGRLTEWVERLIKVHATEQRAQHEEVAQLLAYSVAAAETEQATQNIAIESLKLGRQTAEALAGRDAQAAERILAGSGSLAATVGALPISPLIQAEMIDAIGRWREGLRVAAGSLREQNALITGMDATAATLVRSADRLNGLFTSDAERIGGFVRTILLLGAAIGLLLGAGTALVVARSITEPLKRLKDSMLELAANPAAGPIADAGRRDELGSMARAANFFVSEIRRREEALRQAKDRADATLVELKDTQSNLIQAEKLASLGQLVAGVAHEINTPLGVALTTSTALEREVTSLGERAAGGRLAKSDFSGAVTRLKEGSQLLLANLTRAIELVYSFKQVAADRASGERRRFDMKDWLFELLTSLGPALRKSGHSVEVECPPDLTLDTYPGSLAQVLTNLVMNAIVHGYAPGQAGRLSIRVTRPRPGFVRIIFSDDGRGIAPEHVGKVFDPFFTTGRDRGSTGLGLHIVYNLVTGALQGSLDLRSVPGRGTVFTIDIPATIAEPAEDVA